MESLQEHMLEYKKQLEKGYIPEAYNGLMKYIMGLRVHFKNKYPEYFVSPVFIMDMTYFSLFPESLKRQKWKTITCTIYQVL